MFIIGLQNFKNSKKIISSFSEFDLKKIKIRLSWISYSGFRIYAGITTNADLYYFENILIVTPSKGNYLSFLNRLPIILISKKSNNLPLELNYKMVKDISINKPITLTHIDNDIFLKRRVEYSIYSETDNIELNKAITEFKTFL